jgi:hypothetical protein
MLPRRNPATVFVEVSLPKGPSSAYNAPERLDCACLLLPLVPEHAMRSLRQTALLKNSKRHIKRRSPVREEPPGRIRLQSKLGVI